ncbi:MAG: DHH family phosphoesterase [Candidatus Thermoplasmatota archaeon]|nr:DHH family phosphoesterase [Candidatus Thermoplasmatota archaeon]
MKFDGILTHLAADRKIFILHPLADGDAIASGFVFSNFFGGRCFIPDSMSSTGKMVCRYLKYEPELLTCESLAEAGRVFLLDFSTPKRIGPLAEFIEDPVIIDHHSSSAGIQTPHLFSFPDRSSTAEIAFEIMEHTGKAMDPLLLKAVLLGILTDSGHFRYANARTMENTGKIMELLGTNLEEVMDALESTENPGKNIARLKASQRMRYHRVADFVIAESHISCFEGSCCRAFLFAGADVAIVASGEKGEFRLTGRAKEKLVNSGLDLGRFFSSLSEILPGEGGGHGGAASFNGRGNYRNALKMAVGRMEDEMARLVEK